MVLVGAWFKLQQKVPKLSVLCHENVVENIVKIFSISPWLSSGVRLYNECIKKMAPKTEAD